MSHTFKAGTVTGTPYADTGGGTITVEQDAYVVMDTNANALDLSDGPWTVTVNGTVENDFDDTAAIRMHAHENKVNAKITIGTEGTVYDLGFASTAIFLSQATDIVNSGLIHGGAFAIYTDTVSAGHKYAITNNTTGSILAADDVVRDDQDTTLTVTNAGDIEAGQHAIYRLGLGTTMLTNTGSISGNIVLADGSDKVTTSGRIDGSIDLGAGNNTLTDTKATINGSVTGGSGNDSLANSGSIRDYVHLGDGNNTVTNSGTLLAELTFGGGNDMLTNSGTMLSKATFFDGNNTFTNSGSVIGDTSFGLGNDKLTNNGSIGGHFLTFGGGNDVLINTKTIGADVLFGAGNDSATNSGHIMGLVMMGDGNNVVGNTGTIDGDLSFGTGNDHLTNGGTLGGALLSFGDGSNTLGNTGLIEAGVVGFGSGIDTVTNSGTILGDLSTAGGDDKVTNTGTIGGEIILGDGNDTFLGGNHAEIVADGNGNDSYKLGAGDDLYYALLDSDTGKDTVDGGSGNDVYDASLLNSHAVSVNLDSVQQGNILVGIVAAHSATSVDGPTETVSNFETVIGTNDTVHGDFLIGAAASETLKGLAGNDILWGGAGNDTLLGGDGHDDLSGGSGNDSLDGGNGADLISGDAGVDTLTGGAGDDTFQFGAANESGLTRATRDVITDFEGNSLSVHDVIDLSLIDADTKTTGNQAFTFIGMNTAFTGVAGQLNALFQGDQTIVQGDTNGDGKADFSIAVHSATGHVTLDVGNFVL